MNLCLVGPFSYPSMHINTFSPQLNPNPLNAVSKRVSFVVFGSGLFYRLESGAVQVFVLSGPSPVSHSYHIVAAVSVCLVGKQPEAAVIDYTHQIAISTS